MWLAPPLQRTLEAALRDLGERSVTVRASAVEDLVRYADSPAREDVIAGLLRALSDEAPIVRAKAARALGEAEAISAVPRLIICIEDDDALVRQLSLEALGAIRDPRSEERVRRALSDKRPEVRFQAVLAFTKLVGDDALEALATAARDDDEGIRYVALRSAEELVQGSAAFFSLHPRVPLPSPFLALAKERLDDKAPEVRVAAAILLAAAGDRAGEKVLSLLVEDRLQTKEREDEAAAIEAAGALGLSALIPALEKRAWGAARLVRDRCAFHARVALARLGVAKAKTQILEELGSWSRDKRSHAVVAAGRAALTEARPLLEAMRDEDDRVSSALVDEALVSLARARLGRVSRPSTILEARRHLTTRFSIHPLSDRAP